jgi:hypothetical protein
MSDSVYALAAITLYIGGDVVGSKKTFVLYPLSFIDWDRYCAFAPMEKEPITKL